MFAFLLVVLTVAFEPVEAARVATHLVGAPQLAPALEKICHRESRCQRLGPHRRDARHSEEVFRKAARAGWVDPACQPPEQEWSTRGAFGLMAGYNVRFIGVCVQPAALDVPFLSAWAAAEKMVAYCATPLAERHAATTRWAGGACRFTTIAHPTLLTAFARWTLHRVALRVDVQRKPSRNRTSAPEN
jgi:hypothetical protein